MENTERKNLPSLGALGLAGVGVVLLIVGLCMPWFRPSANSGLFAGELASDKFPIALVQAFALLTAIFAAASIALLFVPGNEKAQKPLNIVRYCVSGASMLFALLALVFAIVYGSLNGFPAMAGGYLTAIGTATIGVSLLLKRISKRRLIQIYAMLLTNANIAGFAIGDIYKGGSKYACVPGFNCYSCPGAIGACPLGSLQNAFANSGTRAPYYVIGILALFGLLFARTICGFLCPVGLGQDLLYKIKSPKLKKSRYTRILSYLKYVFLAVFVFAIPLMYGLDGSAVPAFCKYICPAGTLAGVGLLVNPGNTDKLAMLGPLFTWKFALMCVIVAACVFIYRAFCRFICPLGAVYGFFNKISLLGVKLDKNKCTDCGLCVQHCKMDIKHVGDHECINCGDCISVCPTKAIRWKGSKLFVHANAVDPVPAPETEEKPLGALLNAQAEIAAVEAPASAVPAASTVPQTEPVAPKKSAMPRRKHPKTFWMQIGAWTAALVVMLGAFLYYNVFAGEARANEGVDIGNFFPDFTATAYDDSEFTLSENLGERGTAVILWDGSEESITLLDNFAEAYTSFSAEYPQFAEKMTLVAVQSNATDDQTATLAAHGWEELGITFTRDKAHGLFEKYQSYWMEIEHEKAAPVPNVIVLNANGVIVVRTDGVQEADALLKALYTPCYGHKIGDLTPQFTLQRYGYDANGEYTLLEETISLSDYKGQIVVVNFWATWCGPCIAELPHFNRVQEEHPEITVLAIQGAEDQPVPNFIMNKKDDEGNSWLDYSLTFAQDIVTGTSVKTCETFVAMGGTSYWPYTLIVAPDGTVAFTRHGPLSYDDLTAQVALLQA